MRGREAPRDAGLAKPRGVASTPARLRSAPPPFAIREARLSALHCGVFRLIETALACFRLKTCRKSFSELLAHGSSICPCGGVPDPRDPVDSRTRGHRILLHLPTSPEDAPQRAGRVTCNVPALKCCEGAVQKTKKMSQGPFAQARNRFDLVNRRLQPLRI